MEEEKREDPFWEGKGKRKWGEERRVFIKEQSLRYDIFIRDLSPRTPLQERQLECPFPEGQGQGKRGCQYYYYYWVKDDQPHWPSSSLSLNYLRCLTRKSPKERNNDIIVRKCHQQEKRERMSLDLSLCKCPDLLPLSLTYLRTDPSTLFNDLSE